MTDEYVITLKDVYGITVGGNNYKVASGVLVDMRVKKMTFDFGTTLDDRGTANRRIDTLVPAERGSSTSVGVTTLTDSTRAWYTNQWKGYTLKDSASTQVAIVSNTATALTTASGTPASGQYQILSTKTAYNDRKEYVPITGLANPTIKLDVEFDIITTPADATVNAQTVTALTFKILWDFITIPNVYFLKDYLGSTTSTKTPINTLINAAEIHVPLGAATYVYTTDGMPVVISKVSNLSRNPMETSLGASVPGSIVSCTLELKETRL